MSPLWLKWTVVDIIATCAGADRNLGDSSNSSNSLLRGVLLDYPRGQHRRADSERELKIAKPRASYEACWNELIRQPREGWRSSGREDRFSAADITAVVTVDFATKTMDFPLA